MIINLRSRYSGEQTMNYFLKQIPQDRYMIFNGLRLPIGNEFFQMDVLLLSSKYALIIEGKNHSGIISIEPHQMKQEYMENTRIYENPVSQVIRHKVLLKYFFEQACLPLLPTDFLVVFTKPQTEVQIAPGYREAEKKVCKASDLIRKTEEQYAYYNKEIIDKKTLIKIKNFLLKKHTSLQPDIIKKFNINPSEVRPGVICPKCSSIPMTLKRNTWNCQSCLHISKDAHMEGIKDYFLLYKPYFSNKEIMTFLLLASTRVTSYFVSLLCFPSTGKTKSRTYHQPKDFL